MHALCTTPSSIFFTPHAVSPYTHTYPRTYLTPVHTHYPTHPPIPSPKQQTILRSATLLHLITKTVHALRTCLHTSYLTRPHLVFILYPLPPPVLSPEIHTNSPWCVSIFNFFFLSSPSLIVTITLSIYTNSPNIQCPKYIYQYSPLFLE